MARLKIYDDATDTWDYVTGYGSTTVNQADKTIAVGISVDGSGTAITTGSKGFRTMPFAGTIVGWQIISDQAGSCVVDIKKCAHANFPTTTSVCASAKPTLTTAQIAQDETLTGWTTAITAGDILEFVVDSASTITRMTLTVHVQI